ncbi:MAG: type II toxin-antitoxin system RelE/ParE family toxin [Gammaproteobacteria bacterium]|nr:type II toxin-antitoxin system RelE/ParE family toxin [Gammaproteobacteria bacterium]
MAWKINFTETALKQLKKLDKSVAKKITTYLKERVAPLDDIQMIGKPLLSDLTGLWRFRVEDYRIICEVKKSELTVLVLRLGHRKDIY